jgi:fructose-bisphosphate aldolase class I
MNARFKTQMPWPLTFSFARAIQQPAMTIWGGKPANVTAAQRAIYRRASLNRSARRGEYDSMMETAQ